MLSERNLVIVLFVMVFITFSLAHEDSKKMEKAYTGFNSSAVSQIQAFVNKPVSDLQVQIPVVTD